MKKFILSSLILFITIVGGAFFINSTDSNELKDIQTGAMFEKYDYLELKDSSSVIALVKIEDSLEIENSVINYNENSPFINSYYSIRNATVKKFYKNDKNLSNNISFLEPTAITKNNEYIHPEGYDTLEKGKEYILFLSDQTESGNLSILSANNGKVDLYSIENNEFYDIAIKSIIDFETPTIDFSLEQKEKLLNADIPKTIVDFEYDENSTIHTNFGNLSVSYTFDETSNKEYFDINGLPFIVEDTLFSE